MTLNKIIKIGKLQQINDIQIEFYNLASKKNSNEQNFSFYQNLCDQHDLIN